MADLLLAALHGRGDRATGPVGGSGETLGPLWHVVASADRWRPDWMARVRTILVDAVATWLDTDPDLRSPNTPELAGAALAQTLGFHRYPARRSPKVASKDNTENWRRRCFEHVAVRTRVTARIDAFGPSACDGICESGPSVDWSPWRLDGEDLWLSPDREQWLLRRAARLLLNQGRELSGRDLDETEAKLRGLLVGALSERLAEYFAGAEKEAKNLWLHLRHTVLPAWGRTLFTSLPADTSIEPTQPFRMPEVRAQVEAAVEMLGAHVTSELDDERSLVRCHERLTTERNLHSVWEGVIEAPSAAGLVVASDLAVLETVRHPLVMPGGLVGLLTKAGPAGDLASPQVQPTGGDGWLARAVAIRRSDPMLKRKMLAEYVEMRARELPHQDAMVNMCDHSVFWDMVTEEQHALAWELARMMEENPPKSRMGKVFTAHRFRGLALLANKANRPQEADFLLNLGLNAASELGSVGDLATLECSHQLLLARAGIRVRHLEWLLQMVPAKAGQVRAIWHSASVALRAAGAAYRILNELAPGLPVDLSDVRREGRIATTAWKVQTRIIRLRAALGAATALRSGLCRAEPLSELHDQECELLFRDEARSDAWIELVGQDTLNEAHRVDICRLGLWLAFSRELQLPIASEVGDWFKTLDFFNGDPYGPSSTITLDPYAVTGALRGLDAGWLSWVTSDAAGFLGLRRMSPSFGSWQAEELVRIKAEQLKPSHD